MKARLILPLIAAALSAAPASEPDASLQAHWKLDELRQNEEGREEVIDHGPHQIHLHKREEQPSETLWTPAPGGRRALVFNGASSWVPSGPKEPVSLARGEITVEATVRIAPDWNGESLGILSYTEYPQSGFRLAISSSGRIEWLVACGDREFGTRSPEPVPAGEWMHIAATYDGEFTHLYINGNQVAEGRPEGVAIQPRKNGNLQIGYIGAASRPFFRGEILEIRILDRALTQFPPFEP